LKDLNNLGGQILLNKYRDSLSDLLNAVYSDYKLLPWKFEKFPQNYWDDIDNQRKFMDWAGTKLNITVMSDWYKISIKDITSVGGGSLLKNMYNNSPPRMLINVYSDYDWLPWKFATLPRHYWNDIKNQMKFMDWAEKQLNIKEKSDWYKVTLKVRQK
jgi:hypothetical protein